MGNNELQKNILEKIEKGEVAMKSRTHFALKTALVIAGIFFATLASLFFVSFVLFMLRENGVFLLSSFGFRGIGAILLSVPWLLIGTVIVILIILEVLARNFAFVYRKPLVYSVLGIVVVTTLAGGVLAATPLHKNVLEISEKRHIPVGGALYKRYDGPTLRGGARAGVIVAITENGLVLKERNGNEITIATSTKTKLPKKEIAEGDVVMILGKKDDGDFEAIGVRPLNKERVKSILRKQMERRMELMDVSERPQ